MALAEEEDRHAIVDIMAQSRVGHSRQHASGDLPAQPDELTLEMAPPSERDYLLTHICGPIAR